jgi:hypothetical protein
VNLAQTIKVYLPVPEVHAFIRREGDKHCVKSHSGKNLGCYESADGAKKRLKQVEYFKHLKAEDFYGPNTGGMGPSKALGDPE